MSLLISLLASLVHKSQFQELDVSGLAATDVTEGGMQNTVVT